MTLEDLFDTAFEMLPQLRSVGKKYGLDHDDVDDAIQEAWLALLLNYDRIDPARTQGYIRTVAERKLRDVGRKRRRESQHRMQDEQLDDFADAQVPEGQDSDAFSVAVCEELVSDVVKHLNDRHRDALRLFLSGVQRKDAIAQMGNDYDAALHGARRLIRDRLGDQRDIVLRVGLTRLSEMLRSTAETPSHDTAIDLVGDTDTSLTFAACSSQSTTLAGNPCSFADLLAYARCQADNPTKQHLDKYVKDHPRWWQAHLDSLRYLDLEDLAARQDGDALACFGKSDAQRRPVLGVQQPTEFCRIVARHPETILAQLTPDGDTPIAGKPREEWEQHVEKCVYCRRVHRLALANKIRCEAGLRSDEPLLRDWLLARHYRPELDRITAELGGRPLPFPTAAATTAPPAPLSPPARGHTPQQLNDLALSVRRGDVPSAALREALTPAVSAYFQRLGGDASAHTARVLAQVEDTLPEWNPEARTISAWVLEVCRRSRA